MRKLVSKALIMMCLCGTTIPAAMAASPVSVNACSHSYGKKGRWDSGYKIRYIRRNGIAKSTHNYNHYLKYYWKCKKCGHKKYSGWTYIGTWRNLDVEELCLGRVIV